MRRMASLMLAGALAVFGCAKVGPSRELPEGETPDTTIAPSDPPPTLACDYCVDTAPATFTGPSTFWRGKTANAPPCTDPTPLQGVEGFLIEPTPLVQFVRECRFTPSDTCATEGKVCAPLPDADYQTCVHHTGEVACPDEYAVHREVVVAAAGGLPFVFTLCCTASPVPG